MIVTSTLSSEQRRKLKTCAEVTQLPLPECILLLNSTRWDVEAARQASVSSPSRPSSSAAVSVAANSGAEDGRRRVAHMLAITSRGDSAGKRVGTGGPTLVVSAVRAKDLKHYGMHALEVEVEGKQYKSGWIEGDQSPKFGQAFTFSSFAPNSWVRFTIWHKRTWRDDKRAAEAFFNLSNLREASQSYAGWISLEHKDYHAGKLLVDFRVHPDSQEEHRKLLAQKLAFLREVQLRDARAERERIEKKKEIFEEQDERRREYEEAEHAAEKRLQKEAEAKAERRLKKRLGRPTAVSRRRESSTYSGTTTGDGAVAMEVKGGGQDGPQAYVEFLEEEDNVDEIDDETPVDGEPKGFQQAHWTSTDSCLEPDLCDSKSSVDSSPTSFVDRSRLTPSAVPDATSADHLLQEIFASATTVNDSEFHPNRILSPPPPLLCNSSSLTSFPSTPMSAPVSSSTSLQSSSTGSHPSNCPPKSASVEFDLLSLDEVFKSFQPLNASSSSASYLSPRCYVASSFPSAVETSDSSPAMTTSYPMATGQAIRSQPIVFDNHYSSMSSFASFEPSSSASFSLPAASESHSSLFKGASGCGRHLPTLSHDASNNSSPWSSNLDTSLPSTLNSSRSYAVSLEKSSSRENEKLLRKVSVGSNTSSRSNSSCDSISRKGRRRQSRNGISFPSPHSQHTQESATLMNPFWLVDETKKKKTPSRETSPSLSFTRGPNSSNIDYKSANMSSASPDVSMSLASLHNISLPRRSSFSSANASHNNPFASHPFPTAGFTSSCSSLSSFSTCPSSLVSHSVVSHNQPPSMHSSLPTQSTPIHHSHVHSSIQSSPLNSPPPTQGAAMYSFQAVQSNPMQASPVQPGSGYFPLHTQSGLMQPFSSQSFHIHPVRPSSLTTQYVPMNSLTSNESMCMQPPAASTFPGQVGSIKYSPFVQSYPMASSLAFQPGSVSAKSSPFL